MNGFEIKENTPSFFILKTALVLFFDILNKRMKNLLRLSLFLCALQFPALAAWGQRVAMLLNTFSKNKHLCRMRRKSLHLHSLTSLQWRAPVTDSACVLSYTHTLNQAKETTMINLPPFS